MTKNEKTLKMGIKSNVYNYPFISKTDIVKMFEIHDKTAIIYINEFAEHVGDGKLYPYCTLVVVGGDKRRRQRVGLYAFIHYMTYRRWIVEKKWDMVPKFDVFDIKKGIGNIRFDNDEAKVEEWKQAIKLEVKIQVAKALQKELHLAI